MRPEDVAGDADLTCRATLGLPTYEAALQALIQAAPSLGSEVVALEQASGRVLAAPLLASRNRPARAVAAMDGYAVRTDDRHLWPTGLRVIGTAFPGSPFVGFCGPAEAVRVTTGAWVPNGADRVIVDEAVALVNGAVRVPGDAGAKSHVRPPGSDFCAGDVLIPSGAALSGPRLMAAAAAEVAEVVVQGRPRVAILATGDEIAGNANPGGPDTTPDAISIGLKAIVERWGGVIGDQGACGDTVTDIAARLELAMGGCAIVVVIGGASRSERDGSRAAARARGAEMLFEGVAMKPGRPVWAARRGNRIVLGLPGNPFAAFVAARLFLAPLVARIAEGSERAALAWRRGKTLAPLGAGTHQDVFLAAARVGAAVRPLARQDASCQSLLGEIEGLIRRPMGCRPTDFHADVEWLEA